MKDSTKMCRICGETKPTSDFYRARSTADKLDKRCKACFKAITGEHQRRRARQKKLDSIRNSAQTTIEPLVRKRCSKCKTRKTIGNFCAHGSMRDRLNNTCKACVKARYQEERDQVLAEKKAYYREDRAEVIRKVRAYREANPEKIRATLKAYQQANLDVFRVAGNNRRARERNAPGRYTLEDTNNIRLAQFNLCYYCGVELEDDFQMDHLQPLSRGGSNWPSNLAATCPSCNHRKGAKTEEEFLAYL